MKNSALEKLRHHVTGAIERGEKEAIVESRACDSCEVVMINGHRCHEHGCPDAWKDRKKACFICGFDFKPETKYQSTCVDCSDPS